MYHGGKMRKNKNIFSHKKNIYSGRSKDKGSKALVLLLIIILGSLFGFAIFKLIGEDYFTSKTPILATETQVESAVEIAVNPEDLVENSNHIHAADPMAYSTLDVRNWITSAQPYTGEKIAFLTFDDGPNPGNTDKILDILKEKGARATFFIIGSRIETTSTAGATMNRILSEGSSIGIHSYSHVYTTLYPGNTGNKDIIKAEIDKTQELIRTATGKTTFKSNVFRYPGGHMSWKELESVVDPYLEEDGIEFIDWNAMNGDGEPTSRRPKEAEAMANFVMESLQLSKVKNVMVVLMHDATNKTLTVEALPKIIDILVSEGYTFGILK